MIYRVHRKTAKSNTITKFTTWQEAALYCASLGLGINEIETIYKPSNGKNHEKHRQENHQVRQEG